MKLRNGYETNKSDSGVNVRQPTSVAVQFCSDMLSSDIYCRLSYYLNVTSLLAMLIFYESVKMFAILATFSLRMRSAALSLRC